MRKQIKGFIIYFPVILVSCQVAVNILYFVAKDFYFKYGIILNTIFGTTLLFALFLLAFTIRMCRISKYAAVAQVLFAANYLIIQEDSLYNIMFQIIVGTMALVGTFKHVIKKYPLCKAALLWTFIVSVAEKKGDCYKGISLWEEKIYNTIKQTRHESRA